jgi:hypothetical protein
MLALKRKNLRDPDTLEIARIDDDPAYAALLAELKSLEQRLKETEARRRRARARAAGGRPARSVVERAQDLVRGGQVPPFDAVAELAAADQEEFEILLPAINALRALLDDLRADLSLAVCTRVRDRHDEALVAALHAMEDLAAAFDTAAAIRARVIAAGYNSPPDGALPTLLPHAAQLLGNPAHFGQSAAWFYKNQLEKRGII